jgi:wyosine [tRNA(Phe)-imidazoG37] synthetase (radical SAM superfamily)
MAYVYGPVPSRRLGRSLGVDLVPYKTCTYDCIYCQLGRTTDKTVERKERLRWEPVLDQIKQKLQSRPDYITLSGSGEPTLHARLGELIERIKTITRIPVAVLTNGSLLWRADVRRELREADLVIPSLDAGDELRFRHINRPADSISFSQVVDGLVAFRREFDGQYWLEVFLLAGYTSTETEVRKIAALVRRINPDRVHLNTVTRPPAESFAAPVARERLARLAGLFEPRAEVIADYAQAAPQEQAGVGAKDILEMLRRRPCSVSDITLALGLCANEVLKQLEVLSRQKLIERSIGRQGVYYRAVRSADTVQT